MDLILQISAWIRWASIAAGIILIWQLYRTGLSEVYPWFTRLIVFRAAMALVIAPIPTDTNLYGYLYFFHEVLSWVLLALAVLELYQAVLSRHPGLMQTSRKLMLGSLTAAVFAAVLSAAVDFRGHTQFPLLQNFYLLSRLVNFTLAVFLVMLAGVLIYYPIPLPRNAVVHAWIFSFYFLGRTLLSLAMTRFGEAGRPYTILFTHTVALLASIAWILFLSPAGEARSVKSGHQWSDRDEERLMAQLAAINTALLRSTRK